VVLPGPLVPPAPWPEIRPVRRRGPALPLLAGVLLCTLGVLGGVVWAGAASPYALTRFPLEEGDRVLRFRQGGDYVVFAEGDGGTGGPPDLVVSVLSGDGRAVPVSSPPGHPGGYDVPGFEGREVARFRLADGGAYLLRIRTADGAEAGGTEGVTVAVGRALVAGPLAHPAVGLLAPAAVLAGIGLLVVQVRRGRSRGAGPTQAVR
jgi:hypothetical protein